MSAIEAQDLIEEYRVALLMAGYAPQALTPKRGRQRPTHSREAFEEFAYLKVAPGGTGSSCKILWYLWPARGKRLFGLLFTQ